MSSETVGLEVERQRRIRLIQKQVHPGQLDAVPLEHGTQNLSDETQNPVLSYKAELPVLVFILPVCSPQRFLFHGRNNFCVYVHVEVKLEAEALLTGVLQGEQRHCKFTEVGLPVCRLSAHPQGGSFILQCPAQTENSPEGAITLHLSSEKNGGCCISPTLYRTVFLDWGGLKGPGGVARGGLCVCMISYISVSSPWLLLHQLKPHCFTLPAKTVRHQHKAKESNI